MVVTRRLSSDGYRDLYLRERAIPIWSQPPDTVFQWGMGGKPRAESLGEKEVAGFGGMGSPNAVLLADGTNLDQCVAETRGISGELDCRCIGQVLPLP